MRRTFLVLALAVLSLAGCTSSPPLSNRGAAEAFSSADNAFFSSGRAIETEAGYHGRPSAAQYGQIVNVVDSFRSRLSSIAWPPRAEADAEAVESALSDYATAVRSVAGVSGSSPVLGQDYEAISGIERQELVAENRLRTALGLPTRSSPAATT